MKLFIKLMIFMVFMALAGPFLLKGPDGRPLLTLQKLGVPSLTQMIAMVRNGIPSPATTNTEPSHTSVAPATRGNTFYKWQDKNGVWQFTSEPPPPPTTYNEIHTDPQANIIQSLPKNTIANTLGFSTPESSKEKTQDKEKSAADVASGLSLTTVPVSQIPQLMDDAKMARELMQDHQKSLDQAIGDSEGSSRQDRLHKSKF